MHLVNFPSVFSPRKVCTLVFHGRGLLKMRRRTWACKCGLDFLLFNRSSCEWMDHSFWHDCSFGSAQSCLSTLQGVPFIYLNLQPTASCPFAWKVYKINLNRPCIARYQKCYYWGRKYSFPWVWWNCIINLRSPAFSRWTKRKLITQFHPTHGK